MHIPAPTSIIDRIPLAGAVRRSFQTRIHQRPKCDKTCDQNYQPATSREHYFVKNFGSCQMEQCSKCVGQYGQHNQYKQPLQSK